MPALTGPLHSKALRLLVDGSDFSCLATDVSYTLDGGNVDATAFCHALKSMQYGIVDGKITLNLFYDAGYQGSHVKVLGALTQGAQLNFLVEGEGWKANGQADGFRGIVNSVNPQRQVGNLQALQCEVQIQGELLIGRNLYNWQTEYLRAGTGAGTIWRQARRSTTVDDPKLAVTSALNAYLYYHLYNTDPTNPHTIKISSKATTDAGGDTHTGTEHASIVVPAASFACGLVSGPLKSTVALQDWVRITSDSLSGNVIIPFQLVLIDPTVSFVAG